MTCIFCKGNMTSDTTTDFTDLKTCIVVVRNVPCHKCVQCGEVAYDFNVGEQVEQIIDELRGSLMEVAIINYSGKVA